VRGWKTLEWSHFSVLSNSPLFHFHAFHLILFQANVPVSDSEHELTKIFGEHRRVAETVKMEEERRRGFFPHLLDPFAFQPVPIDP
jgi:hypothetical protein